MNTVRFEIPAAGISWVMFFWVMRQQNCLAFVNLARTVCEGPRRWNGEETVALSLLQYSHSLAWEALTHTGTAEGIRLGPGEMHDSIIRTAFDVDVENALKFLYDGAQVKRIGPKRPGQPFMSEQEFHFCYCCGNVEKKGSRISIRASKWLAGPKKTKEKKRKRKMGDKRRPKS